MNLKTVSMSVYQETWEPGDVSNPLPGYQSLWVKSGEIQVDGARVAEGEGANLGINETFANKSTSSAEVIRFLITGHGSDLGAKGTSFPSGKGKLVLSEDFEVDQDNVVMRLDQVDFPAGAVAYRHTHTGAGIRYLDHGFLKIIADDQSHGIQPGQAWFEGVLSPVRAEATDREPSMFVRTMLIPLEYEGKPTIKVLDPEDQKKPRMQGNLRYFDIQIDLGQL